MSPPLSRMTPALRRAAMRRNMSTTAPRRNVDYESTRKNLMLNSNTRVMMQGFTGKQATANAVQSIDWGTKIVGGVTPGKSGQHLGLPLYGTVAEAAKNLKPDASAVFVAAPYAGSAIEEAIAAEIPLIVAVAEWVPAHDMLRVQEILRTQSKSRLVGANCPGMINPGARCRIGFMPHPTFLPGDIGIVGKSGTLSYEAVGSTTRAGLGQSLVIGMGGDALAGTTQVDAVKTFMEDPETEGIVMIGEIGGSAELEVADVVREYKANGGKKPIMGLIAGHCAVPGRVMGHAGASRAVGDPSVMDKVRALEAAGVVIVDHPGMFGEGMARLLGRSVPREPVQGMGFGSLQQKRGLHTTMRRRPASTLLHPSQQQQTRKLHIKDSANAQKVLKMLAPKLPTSETPPTGPTFSIGIKIDRKSYSPSLILSSATVPFTSIPFAYTTGPDASTIASALSTLSHSKTDTAALTSLASSLWKLFLDSKAYTVYFTQAVLSPRPTLHLPPTDEAVVMHLDPTNPRLPINAYTFHDSLEKDAAPHGIVYHTLPGEGTIGTLVNGAGLAMNTCDVLLRRGGHPANFLDTGGKATGKTVVESFRAVLGDKRVRVIFVNIYGGLTDCVMIAEGILMAYKELDMNGLGLPLVVRLRGTNEREGQKMLRDSGLPLLEFDDLEDAVAKAIELADGKP